MIFIPRLFIAISLILSIKVTADAQYTAASESDPEALALLAKAGKAFSGSNTEVSFIYKYSFPGQEATPMTGVMYRNGNMYCIELDDFSIRSDGKTRWVYLKKDNEVNIYSESKGQDWISPQDFLQLDKAQDLVFAHAGTKSDGTSIIEAKPLKGRFEDYSKFTVYVRHDVLSAVRALAKDGTRQELNITNVTHPSTLDAAKLFNFRTADYPGVHVEDLRID